MLLIFALIGQICGVLEQVHHNTLDSISNCNHHWTISHQKNNHSHNLHSLVYSPQFVSEVVFEEVEVVVYVLWLASLLL